MKNFLKIFMSTIMCLLMFIQICFAGNGYSYNSIDSYVGKKIVDLNYYHSSGGYYPYKKRLDRNGNLQCVGYAYARLEEKLGLSPDFSSGLGAKDIPSNAPNGATRTAINGTVYTIEVYKNDGGKNITSNCWVSFGAGSSQYGHVIFVEEVIGDTVYYTESGTSMWKKGTSGTLKKKSKNNFINNCSSGGKYVGTVVFKPVKTSSTTRKYSYNASKALTYAANHWNDGVGLCAEFVWNCVKEGGISFNKATTTRTCFNKILENSYATKYQLKLNSNGKATKSANSAMLSPGDVVVQYCTTCDLYPHILLFSKFDSEGNALYYAHNSAMNNKTYTLNKNPQHESSCNIIAYVAHFPQSSTPIITEPEPEISSVKISPNSYPSGNLKYGKDFTLTAKFTSDCAIIEAKAYMLDSNKNVVQEAKGSSTTGNYYVEGYALDKGMKFDQLAPGGYYLKYYVKDANGDTATWTSNKFYIVKESTPISGGSSGSSSSSGSQTSKPTIPSTSIRFEIESMPKGNLPYGKSFSLKGWFRSDSAIVEARAYMLDSNKNVVMQSEPASSTTSNYKIQGYKLDKAMKFDKLSPGGYYLKFFVRDANGDTFTWVSDKFYIVK